MTLPPDGKARDAGAPPPGPQPPPPGRADADVIAAPFVVLAAGALPAWALGAALASALRGDWFSMERLGYWLAWGGYALAGALFLWLDAGGARRLPDLTWPGRAAMWRATLACAGKALALALPLGVLLALMVSNLARTTSLSDGFIVVMLAALGVALLAGAARNVRARRATRTAL